MNEPEGIIEHLQARAAEYGLVLRGGFLLAEDDVLPECQPGVPSAQLLLFGQVGSSLWTCFSASPEYADGEADPMDRWSRRIGETLAAEAGGRALFPFEGPPWQPFGQWAQRAEAVQPSPLGILIHPEFGLWHAYRFAMVLPETAGSSVVATDTTGSPACDRCADQPCLHACPVDAFADGRYDVARCADYLSGNEEALCHRAGCLARAACPEAREHAYEAAHCQFHMRQFLHARWGDP